MMWLRDDTTELSTGDVDDILRPIGLSFLDLALAVECPGPLSDGWLHEACARLTVALGTSKFIIHDEEGFG